MDASSSILRDAAVLMPEIFLALAVMTLLLIGVYRRENAAGFVYGASLWVLLIATGLLFLRPEGAFEAFDGSFIDDAFARIVKSIVLLGALGALLVAHAFARAEEIERFEYPILALIAVLGMMVMLSAHNLIAMYMGLEMQSLALYVIAAFNRSSVRASEAGLKYFVLGALSSGMLLYGCGLIYGFAGSVEFSVLRQMPLLDTPGTTVGLVFVLAGIAFKVSAVPFHMWTPDVYEGAPMPATLFLAAAPKIAALGLFARLLLDGFTAAEEVWRDIIVILSAASMLLGAVAAIGQTSLKRLIAYSSIGHMGYALIGLAAGAGAGVQSLVVYMVIYIVMVLGTFCALLCLRRSGEAIEDLNDLAGLSRTHPVMALLLAALFFSLAGIPPLAGFFAKLYVFLAAISSGLYILAIIGVVSSVIGAYYYLRLVKILYVDEPGEALELMLPARARLVLIVSGVITIFFVLFPFVATEPARMAAAYFGGAP